MTLYVLAGVLIVVLVVASCAALILGLFGEMGVVTLARCPECDHLVMGGPGTPRAGCYYCRHDHLVHPLRTMRMLVHH